MEIIHTLIEDCYIIKPSIFSDTRGHFFESFNEREFNKLTGNTVNFVQDNQSWSTYGVIRGLHFQEGEYAQAKLVRVLRGTVLDVAVDLREESSTFGKHVAVKLSAENKLQFFIPKGFAHGFAVLSEEAEFFYKCDNYYTKSSEDGIIYNDFDLNINWELPEKDIIVSDKDRLLNSFSAYSMRYDEIRFVV